jgi:hypothetical protein
MSGEEQPDKDAEIRKLAAAAKDVSIVTAVHDLDGQFLHFMVREQAAYKAAAGDGATDKGLAEWINRKAAEMQACWAHDVAVVSGKNCRDSQAESHDSLEAGTRPASGARGRSGRGPATQGGAAGSGTRLADRKRSAP